MTTAKPSVLIIGAGMYVCGRGSATDGTVLPTVMMAQSKGLIGDIKVAATSRSSIDWIQNKVVELNAKLGLDVRIEGYPTFKSQDSSSYRIALSDLELPACAIVVVPDHLHVPITADAIKLGVHTLVVKPLAPTLRETNYLVELAEKYGIYGSVEFHKRFDESNLVLRQALRDGRLGELRYVSVEYSQRRMIRNVFTAWLNKTNIFQYLGIHYVDLIYHLTGARPIRALATGQPSGPDIHKIEAFDSIQAMIEWEELGTKSRFVSTILTNWIDPDTTSAMSDQKITMVGVNGRYQLDQKNRGAQLVTEDVGVEDINPYFTQFYKGADGQIGVNGYGPKCISQFLTDIRDLSVGDVELSELVRNRASFQDCLASTAVIEAVNKSLASEGHWVEVEDYRGDA